MKNDAGMKSDAGMKGEADMSVEKPFIVHLCSREDWQAAQKKGEYRPDSLDTEGFIHNSVLVKIILNINNYISQMRLANSSGDNPGIGSP